MNCSVRDVTEGAEYEFRVAAINESGSGDLSPPSAMVCAKNPNSKLLDVHDLNLRPSVIWVLTLWWLCCKLNLRFVVFPH